MNIRSASLASDLNLYCATHRAGRCTSGTEGGRGVVLHAVRRGSFEGVGAALCGVAPGPRSAGWSCTMLPLDRVTCVRCLAAVSAAGLEGHCADGRAMDEQGRSSTPSGTAAQGGAQSGKRVTKP